MPVPQRQQGSVVSWSDEDGYRRKRVWWPSEATFWKQKCVLIYWFHISWWRSAPALLPSLLPETEVCFTSMGYHSSLLFQLLMRDWASVMVIYKGGGEQVDTSIQTVLCSTHSLTGIFRSDANLSLAQSHGVWASDTRSSWEVPAGSLSWLQSSVSAFWTIKASCWQQLDAACDACYRLTALLFVCCKNEPKKAKTHPNSVLDA